MLEGIIPLDASYGELVTVKLLGRREVPLSGSRLVVSRLLDEMKVPLSGKLLDVGVVTLVGNTMLDKSVVKVVVKPVLGA